ncbi:MAG TPA: patatin-like phospholipase family protein [Ramlibacter sp.]|uniref:patatin-like phospholipase family protein n=1 Tax=Ramlibacter sp. TaxID=1917967 RepID=UPI002BB3D5B1|nr:patatin-like phospholipase family protein [Ramlibacter sp.]HVZ46200.1 patatin-like phospholipase family protein [Ramlibacter sp.]
MPKLNLALQGGGSHGAFTWGVLDGLLADGRIEPEGLSGTSAGAVNAVALASGWAGAARSGGDPREAARESLSRIWGQVAAWGALGAWPQRIAAMLWGGVVSPYQANPLDINPLRDLLAREIDFEAIARHPVLRVFVSATHVATGKAAVFTGSRLGVDEVMASCCLPMLFKAVEIDGSAYWDGGYSVNPALGPLIHGCESADLMLVQINPVRRDATPRTTAEILDRVSELTFNASLLTQIRAIDYVNRLVAEGSLSPARGKLMRVHRIDGGPATANYPAGTRGNADAAMLAELFEAGRLAAAQWLKLHFHALGRSATVDIERDYLDDTRLALPARTAPEAKRRGGWRAWLARLRFS